MKKPKRTEIPYSRRVQSYHESFMQCTIPECLSTGSSLEIHHIDGNRTLSYDHRLENLIVLCRNHHRQAHTGEFTLDQICKLKIILQSETYRIQTLNIEAILIEINDYIVNGYLDKAEAALLILGKYFRFSSKCPRLKENAEFKMLFADLKMQQGDIIKAFNYGNVAFNIFLEIDDLEGMVQTRAILGSAARMNNDLKAAEFFNRDALSLIPRIEPESVKTEKERWIKTNLGNVLGLKGELDEGLSYIESSLEIIEQYHKLSEEGKAESYSRCAMIFLFQNNTAKAYDLFNKAVNYANASNKRWILGILQKIKVDFFLKLQDMHCAKSEMQLAWEFNKGYGHQIKELVKRIEAYPECCPEQVYEYMLKSHEKCPYCDKSSIKNMARCCQHRIIRELLI